MTTDRDSAIRERAHAIWEEEGRSEGRSLEHWVRAEREHGAPEPAGAKPAAVRRRAAPAAHLEAAPAKRRAASAGSKSPAKAKAAKQTAAKEAPARRKRTAKPEGLHA